MDEVAALQVVDDLSNGVHPLTGEALAEEHFCHHPQVVRALCLAARALEERRQRWQRPRNLPANAGKTWDKQETQVLLDAFHAGKSNDEIAQRLGRTPGSVQTRLEKLGLAQPGLPQYD